MNEDLQLVEGLIVQPGDTLLVRVDPDRIRSEDHVQEIKQRVESKVPAGVNVVLVVADEFALVLSGRAS